MLPLIYSFTHWRHLGGFQTLIKIKLLHTFIYKVLCGRKVAELCDESVFSVIRNGWLSSRAATPSFIPDSMLCSPYCCHHLELVLWIFDVCFGCNPWTKDIFSIYLSYWFFMTILIFIIECWHSSKCVVICFNLRFPNALICYLCFLGRYLLRFFLLFFLFLFLFQWVILFLIVVKALCIFWITFFQIRRFLVVFPFNILMAFFTGQF